MASTIDFTHQGAQSAAEIIRAHEKGPKKKRHQVRCNHNHIHGCNKKIQAVVELPAGLSDDEIEKRLKGYLCPTCAAGFDREKQRVEEDYNALVLRALAVDKPPPKDEMIPMLLKRVDDLNTAIKKLGLK